MSLTQFGDREKVFSHDLFPFLGSMSGAEEASMPEGSFQSHEKESPFCSVHCTVHCTGDGVDIISARLQTQTWLINYMYCMYVYLGKSAYCTLYCWKRGKFIGCKSIAFTSIVCIIIISSTTYSFRLYPLVSTVRTTVPVCMHLRN